MEKHRKNKIIKKRRMRKFVSAESPMMTQDGRLVYFAQQEYQNLVLPLSSDGWGRNSELEEKFNPDLYSPCIDTLTTLAKKANVPSDAEYSIPEACCFRKKTYW